MYFLTLINFLYQILQLLEVVLCYVICRHILLHYSNTTDLALTLLHISNNITAVAVTLVVFFQMNYFQMILETCMIDQHLNFINLKIEIISISIRARISLTRL